MTVTKTQVLNEDGSAKRNPDGSLFFDYAYEGDPAGGLLVTGPISGTIFLKNNASYNVTEPVIEFAPGDSGPILHHIERKHELAGTFTLANGEPFKHVCTEDCGEEADAALDPPAPPAAPAASEGIPAAS
jgi:hypothetical protein